MGLAEKLTALRKVIWTEGGEINAGKKICSFSGVRGLRFDSFRFRIYKRS